MFKMKKHYLALIAAGALIIFVGSNTAFAENDTFTLPKALQGLKISGQAYLDYAAGDTGQSNGTHTSANAFTLGRGYLTVTKKVNPWLSGRITTDITRDSTGHWETYLKYLYAQFKPGNLGFLTQTKIEVGQGHTPWIDFNEHINPYRCLINTPLDLTGAMPSADIGVSVQGYLGGELADAKARVGSPHYDGKYGSWHIGLYNGGGYHAGENNSNKVIEGRLTIRPLPALVPGLQLSYLGVYGKGNVDKVQYNGHTLSNSPPDFHINLGMISYQNPIVIFTAQYFRTKGNSGGSWFDADGNALDTEGYAFFGNVKLSMLTPKLAVFGRYDHFDKNTNGAILPGDSAKSNHDTKQVFIGGVSYQLYKGTQLVVAYEKVKYGNDWGGAGNNPGDDNQFKTALEINF